jgi:hypothetical protein
MTRTFPPPPVLKFAGQFRPTLILHFAFFILHFPRPRRRNSRRHVRRNTVVETATHPLARPAQGVRAPVDCFLGHAKHVRDLLRREELQSLTR